MTLVASSNNALAFIHYITNYVTKNDHSQYQRIIRAVFVKKAYDDMQSLSADVIIHMAPDKFAF